MCLYAVLSVTLPIYDTRHPPHDTKNQPLPPNTLSRRIMRGFNRATLTQARTTAGLSRQDLARLARTGRATIDNWETGRSTPQIDVLVRVAEVLSLPVDALIDIPEDQRYPGDWRVLRGLTQPQLAAATGLSTTTIGAIERGEVALTDANAAAIARALNIDDTTYQQAYERARTRPPGTPA